MRMTPGSRLWITWGHRTSKPPQSMNARLGACLRRFTRVSHGGSGTIPFAEFLQKVSIPKDSPWTPSDDDRQRCKAAWDSAVQQKMALRERSGRRSPRCSPKSAAKGKDVAVAVKTTSWLSHRPRPAATTTSPASAEKSPTDTDEPSLTAEPVGVHLEVPPEPHESEPMASASMQTDPAGAEAPQDDLVERSEVGNQVSPVSPGATAASMGSLATSPLSFVPDTDSSPESKSSSNQNINERLERARRLKKGRASLCSAPPAAPPAASPAAPSAVPSAVPSADNICEGPHNI